MNISFNVLSDNSIQLTPYHEIEKRYIYANKTYKYDKWDKVFKKWDCDDISRIQKNYNASLKRAVKNIKALSDLNKFDYFVTITFNQNYVNRKSAVDVHNHFKLIIKRLGYNFDGIEYLATPEFHFDEAIHYHCFMNFGKAPKLHYKGVTLKGHAYYTIAESDRFKNNDCFITIEKLEKEQPVWYLVKYMTKSQGKPLHRRFMCSRGLNRIRRISNVKIDIPSPLFQKIEHEFNDFVKYGYESRPMYRYTPKACENESACNALDLSKKNIKGENEREQTMQKYYYLLGKLLEYGKIIPPKQKEVEETLPF